MSTMGRPRKDPNRTAAGAKLLNFRLFEDELDALETALFHAKVSRQTVVTALLREFVDGRIKVDKDGAVTYPRPAGDTDESAGTDD